ncbi:sulfotransferase [uncultured Jannaschia sp.]|uniref:sulfotransferase family protein n=1 Tax=uncultured Jannaschia sp. TaxID=293347 RepID=UPI00345B730C
MNDRSSPPERSDMPPFFIVGSGRSGTTLLRSLLAAHSRIAVTPETHFMKRADREGAQSREAPEDFDAFWRDLVAWSRFREIDVDPAQVLARIKAQGRRDFRTVFAAMLEAYGETTGKPRVGEKTPGHYRYLDRIFAWFPDTRVLVLRRDPRDVVASHLNAPWVTDQMGPPQLCAPIVRRLRTYHVAERALLWRQANGEILADAESDPRLHVVIYEALVDRPEKELRRICAFLGESYEPDMLAPRENSTISTTDTIRVQWGDWAGTHRTRAAASVSAGSVGRWRERLSPDEVGLIESICGPAMARQGYRPEMPRSPRRFFGQALLHVGLAEDQVRQLIARGKAQLARG